MQFFMIASASFSCHFSVISMALKIIEQNKKKHAHDKWVTQLNCFFSYQQFFSDKGRIIHFPGFLFCIDHQRATIFQGYRLTTWASLHCCLCNHFQATVSSVRLRARFSKAFLCCVQFKFLHNNTLISEGNQPTKKTT